MIQSTVDPNLLMKPGEKGKFSALLTTVGAGLGASEKKLRGIVTSLEHFPEFRLVVTNESPTGLITGNVWIKVMVPQQDYDQYLSQEKMARNNRRNKNFLQVLPYILVWVLVISTMIGLLFGLTYRGGDIDFGTRINVFLIAAGITFLVSGIGVAVKFFLDGHKEPPSI